eukprot:gene15834-biopygen9748
MQKCAPACMSCQCVKARMLPDWGLVGPGCRIAVERCGRLKGGWVPAEGGPSGHSREGGGPKAPAERKRGGSGHLGMARFQPSIGG